MKRTPLKRKTPLRSGSALARSESNLARRPIVRSRRPIRAISERRANERNARHAALASVRQRDGDRCWYAVLRLAGNEGSCRYFATRQKLEGHEVIPRSAWSGGHLVPENIRMLCPYHHDIVTDAVGELREWCFDNGLRGHAWDRPG